MGTHPIFESDFDCLTDWEKMAKSLRSKRIKRNQAMKGARNEPRVARRLKDALEKAKVFNAKREEEKAKELEKKDGVEMEDVSETPKDNIEEMEHSNKLTLNPKTGLMSDGSKPVWMSHKKFKTLQMKSKGRKDKFGAVLEGLGPHRKFLRAKKKNWRKK